MIWGITLYPGQEFTRKVVSDEHLTLAALECRADRCVGGGRPNACLLLETGREQHVLCTLEEGVVNQQCLDLILEKGEKVTFLVEGTGIVYLTGYSSVKRQQKLSWPIRDNEGANIEADDTVNGETPTECEKDIKSDDDVIQEVCGNHGDDRRNQHNGADNQVVCSEESGARDVLIGSKGNIEGKSVERRRTAVDCYNQTGSVVRVIKVTDGDIIVEEKANLNENHHEVGHNKLASENLEEMTVLPEKVTKKAGRNTSVTSRKAKVSSRTKGLKTKSIQQDENKSPPRMVLKHKCFKCLKGFAKKASCKAHEKVCRKGTELELKKHDEAPYQGRFCGKPFEKLSEQQTHEESHPKEEPYECRFCEKRFATLDLARSHESIHMAKKQYQCQFCPKMFVANCYLVEHTRSHTGEKPFQCKICQEAFTSRSAHRKHAVRHQLRFQNLHCSKCGKCFSTQKRLEQHMKLHADGPKYQCRHCNMTFDVEYQRKRHERLVHAAEKDVHVNGRS